MAPAGPVDSYEALTARSIPVDKRVSGSDAGSMQLAVVLALGGFFALLIVGSILLAIVLTVGAIWKMRKDEFWDEPPG